MKQGKTILMVVSRWMGGYTVDMTEYVWMMFTLCNTLSALMANELTLGECCYSLYLSQDDEASGGRK